MILQRDTNRSFSVGPLSFFQPNTYTNELIQKKIRQWIIELGIPKESLVVVDVCSGVGSITLNVADLCAKTIGIEEVSEVELEF